MNYILFLAWNLLTLNTIFLLYKSGYMSQGFLSVQHAISKNFMKNLRKTQDLELDLQMCRYPYPPYLDDKFILALQLFFPMIICFSFIYPAVNIVKNIVVEKEKKLKVSFIFLRSIYFLCIQIIDSSFTLSNVNI